MKRIYGFDYIRAVSAILIMLYHYTTMYYDEYFKVGSNANHMGLWWGCYAVSVFFMLSAFLTVFNLTENDKSGIFLLKRAIRLYPAYWAGIIITTSLTLMLESDRFIGVIPTIINLTMLQGFIGVPAVDGVYWTLRYELWFYIIIAVIIKLRQIKRLDIFCLIWLVAVAIYKICLLYIEHNKIYTLISLLIIPNQAHIFVLGMSMALIVKNKKSIVPYLNAIAAVCMNGVNLRTLFIIVAMFLMFVFAFTKYRFKADRPMVFIASISYPLYLIHQRIGYMIMYKLNVTRYGIRGAVITGLCILVSLFIAAIIHELVEISLTKILKMKLLSRRA